MDTTLHDPLLGRMLDGRYRVEQRIAVGGMATVYRAMDTRLDRVVALKAMHTGLASDPDFTDRFIREAKAVARLSHPNVVNVYDQGADNGVVFLTMEYVPGWTLRDLLRDRGALSPRMVLDVLEPILAALGAAHRAGLVHRDVKPENVLLSEDGRVKVADFGLVRAMSGDSAVTSGQVMGTVAYLAPEQIEQGATDPRTDVYACGVMMFEMLTGGKPHQGESPMQVLYQAMSNDVPPPSTLLPGLPPQLDAIVLAATARDADRRPRDAVELLATLQHIRPGLTQQQLDAEPGATLHLRVPGAVPGPADRQAVADRTTVLPAGMPAPLPPDPGLEAQLNRTSIMPSMRDLPPELIMPRREEPEQFAPPPPRRGGRGGGRSKGRRNRWALPVTVLVVLALIVGGATWALNNALYTTMPGVVGLTQSAAQTQLTADGLSVSTTPEFSSSVPAGQVIASDPGAGSRVRKDSTVTLDVSKGPNRPKVPDVAGKSLSAAEAAISAAGLTPGTVTEQSSSTAQGDVVGTDPAAGTAHTPNTVVNLVVSSGPAPVALPNVVGEPQDQATGDLRAAGFNVQVQSGAVNSGVPGGSVVSESPNGPTAAAGSTVILTISSGPVQVTVPDVSGDTEAQARAALTAAGFKVKVHRFLPFGTPTVADQSPAGNSQADQGSTVTISLF
ncbi:Stk1 family PASTA domain-containing Ser/Thr kinase [Streptacidiphilus albus]|uniref:Stk1 family PASTA domain-containing Ser/Thr kinase n=1 Tax=Streptacidiphilus albus TaxID=105425 RepID=UPI00054B49D6|nr:Stk1 family PASTA domain-containing Ser/Thr kinase [Streptacidiphilus albus]